MPLSICMRMPVQSCLDESETVYLFGTVLMKFTSPPWQWDRLHHRGMAEFHRACISGTCMHAGKACRGGYTRPIRDPSHPTDPTINVHGLGLRLAQIFRRGLRDWDWSVHARYRGSYGYRGVRRDGRRGIRVHTMFGVRARPMENLFTLGSPRIASRSSPPEDRSWQQWRRQSMHITTVLCY